MTMLEVRGLSVAYGQHRALDGASVRVGRGEIVVILGANGAGKSSLLKAVAGICEGRVAGEVLLEGTDISGMPPHRIVEQGVALVPEGRGVFGDLAVEENLTLGAYGPRARDEEAGNLDRVMGLFPKLGERRRQVVRTMSGGEQQMVAIGRAMMSNPRILMLDEPSLGLSPLLSKELFAALRKVADSGIGVLLVEQNAKQSLAIADRGYLLENGRIVHEGRAADLADDPAVQRAYLGGGVATGARRAVSVPASPSAPRPAAGPSPSEIAAAAMAGLTARAPAAPPPAPRPAPVAAAPAPVPSSVPRPASPPPASPPPAPAAPASLTVAPGGIRIDDLVARAAAMSSRRATPPAGAMPPPAPISPPPRPAPNGHVAPAAPALAPRLPTVPMPDLTAQGDRLRAALREIEEAAARARDWRPPRP
jgi:branched-chain amino acid transport system ATP-binding protein